MPDDWLNWSVTWLVTWPVKMKTLIKHPFDKISLGPRTLIPSNTRPSPFGLSWSSSLFTVSTFCLSFDLLWTIEAGFMFCKHGYLIPRSMKSKLSNKSETRFMCVIYLVMAICLPAYLWLDFMQAFWMTRCQAISWTCSFVLKARSPVANILQRKVIVIGDGCLF